MQHDFIMRSKMSVIKSKMGTIKSKIGRKFEQKRIAKWVKEKANLVKAYLLLNPARVDVRMRRIWAVQLTLSSPCESLVPRLRT